MKSRIHPAVIAKDFKEISSKIGLLLPAANSFQIDVMDGQFTTAHTWPYIDAETQDIELLATLPPLELEIHLMVQNPEESAGQWAAIDHVRRVLVHFESSTHLARALADIKSQKKQAGIVLMYETPIEVLAPFVDEIDHVQLMAIGQIGAYGHDFEPGIFNKIKKLREAFPGLTIEIDGGVSLDNASELCDAGSDELVVGSALFASPDPVAAYAQFEALISR